MDEIWLVGNNVTYLYIFNDIKMQTIFNLSQAEVENLLKDHETEEVSIQVQMSKSENLPSTVTEEPSQFDSQFGESQLGDTSGKFLIAYDQSSAK